MSFYLQKDQHAETVSELSMFAKNLNPDISWD